MANSIVIIDDNAGFRATARRVLEAEGYEVVAEAGAGCPGVSAALESGADLAIVDIQLPDIDGFEVARRIGAADTAPVVVLTSSRDRSDFGSLVELSPAAGFVPKAELSGRSLETLTA
jgi:DNA-binding NarL/FixJ family response regulator